MTISKLTHTFMLTACLGIASISTSIPAWSYTATEAQSDISTFISQLPIEGTPSFGSVDVSGDSVTATDISFSFSGVINLKVSIGSLTTNNLHAIDGDRFEADSMLLEAFVITGDVEGQKLVYDMDKIMISDLGGLQKLFPTISEDDPFGAIVEIAGVFANLEFSALTIDTFSVSSKDDQVDISETFNDYKLINLKNGRLELASTGPAQIVATIDGETLLFTMESSLVKNIDYGVLAKLFSEKDGTRDDTVLPVMEDMVMNDMKVIFPENAGYVTIRSVRMSDMWMRQLPISIATISAGITDPLSMEEKTAMFEKPQFIIDLVRSYGVGLVEMNDLVVNVPEEGVDVSIGRIAYGGSTNGEDRLGEIAFQNISLSVPKEEVSLKLESATLKGFDYSKLLDSVAKAKDLDNFIPDSIPSLELMQIKGLDVKGPDGVSFSIANYELEIGESVGLMPTFMRLGLEHLKMPAALVDDRDAQELLAALGIENIDVSYKARMDWDVSAQTLSLSGVNMTLADAGEINIDASVGGIEQTMFMTEPDPEKMMGKVSLRSAAVSYSDNSLFDKLVKFGAEQMGGSPDDLKGMMKMQSGMMLGQFGESEALTKLSNAIASFVDNPGKLSISINPDEPRLLAELMGLAMMNPAMIADVLNLDTVASSN